MYYFKRLQFNPMDQTLCKNKKIRSDSRILWSKTEKQIFNVWQLLFDPIFEDHRDLNVFLNCVTIGCSRNMRSKLNDMIRKFVAEYRHE